MNEQTAGTSHTNLGARAGLTLIYQTDALGKTLIRALNNTTRPFVVGRRFYFF